MNKLQYPYANSFLVLLAATLAARGGESENALDRTFPVRGFCIAAPGPKDVDKFVTFIDSELVPRHINTLVLRVDYNFQFKAHPEIGEKSGLSVMDAKKLAAVCRRDHIHLVPCMDLLGHQSWASHLGGLLRSHPEFDETPWIKMPVKYKWPNADKLYCKSYCPLHPGLHEVLFACVDEVCDAFEADAFHAGMDEVFYIGENKCPLCGGKDPAELFAGEVTAIDNHLKERGRKLWIWGDRLLDGKTTGLGEWEASEVGTDRAIDLIPKDVMICDWHYERPDPTPVYFAIKGFHVIICPYRKSDVAVEEVDEMAQWHATASEKMKGRFEGVMQTAWNSVEGFLAKDYHSDPTATNAWNCFVATSTEMENVSGRQPESKQ